MEESALREQIQQKISEGTLPSTRYLRVCPPTLLISRSKKPAVNRVLSVVASLIHHSPSVSFAPQIHPNMRFFFHPACEQLWRDEASRFGSPHP